jgi:hypothetical protein
MFFFDCARHSATLPKKLLQWQYHNSLPLAATYIASSQGTATLVTDSRNLDTPMASEMKPTFGIELNGDFKDLVTQNTIFADKSLFIKDVIEDGYTVLLLAMPRRWGKSVNLDMLKRFLEIPVDDNGASIIDKSCTDNYKLFAGGRVDVGIRGEIMLSPLKISEAILFGKTKASNVQGTYPVIYVDFKDCKSDRFDTVREGVTTVLKKCFRQHRYLEKSDHLDEEAKELIKRYMGDVSSKELSDHKITYGLLFLSKMLYRHYGKKKVWILIDEYDAVANVAYTKFNTDDLYKTINLFAGIYETALKGNPYLQNGVLTGVQYIAQICPNNWGKFDFTNAKYVQYYGLDQGEVDIFFGHFEVPKPLGDSAKSWYNGYQVPKYNGNSVTSLRELVSKYNIWSIVSYLKGGEFSHFKSHWEESGNIDFLDELLTKPEVREKVEKLIDGACISFDREDTFSENDFKQLKNMISGNKEISPGGLFVLFSYLFIEGYLTMDSYSKYSYRLPNMEIMYEMGKRLIKYYQCICTIDPVTIQSVTNVLQDIVSVPHQERMQEHFKNFYDRFKEVIRTVRLAGDKDAEVVFADEDFICSLLNNIALQTQHATFGSELYTTKLHSKQRGQAVIKITNKDVGVIIEIKCVPLSDRSNELMKEALEQAMSYGNLLDTHENLFIAVNVNRLTHCIEERAIEFLCASVMSDGQHIFGINASGDSDTFGVDNSIMSKKRLKRNQQT